MIELIAKDKAEKLQFEGRCKLTIDAISKLLLVEPVDEEYKMISALFNWQFIAAKNIIFVFADYNHQDFALIFDNESRYEKVFKVLLKKGATAGKNQLIQQRFLPPIFIEISKNNETSLKLKEILFNWIKKQESKEKDEYIQLLKENRIYDFIYARKEQNIQNYFGKRKAKDINEESDNQLTDAADCNNSKGSLQNSPSSRIIEASNFDVFKYVASGTLKTKLLIFREIDGEKCCYKYYFNKSKDRFIGHNCRRRKNQLSAKVIKRNGKDVIQLNNTHHFSTFREYKKILEKSNFEAVCFDHRKESKKRIIIFLDSSRTSCYEYYAWSNNSSAYYCFGCIKKKLRNGAKLYRKEDGTEFLLLNSTKHVCESMQFNPDKYGEREIIEAENFKIFKETKNGIDKSKMVIFTSDIRKWCYEYFWESSSRKFSCSGCKNKKRNVGAKIFRHAVDERNYLKLSKMKHVCEPREYDPGKFEPAKKEVVENSNFKIFRYMHKGERISRLIVFYPTNKSLCYEYFYHKKLKIYCCCSCPFNHQVTATVCQKNNDSKDVILSTKNDHICDLRQFDPDKYKDDVVIDKSMYFISTKTVRNAANQKSICIFASHDKKQYYTFSYHAGHKCHICVRCQRLNVHVTAVIQNNGKENEFVYLNNQRHACEPNENSLLLENNIIKAPNFQLTERKYNSKSSQHLIVFTNDERTECYDYTWNRQSKCFICLKCRNIKTSVYAKLIKGDDDSEECVELCQTQHKCTPTKFVAEDITSRIVKQPNFKLWETISHNKKVKRLTIFDTNNKSFGYIYFYAGKDKCYKCQPCVMKHNYVTAKVLQDENGEDYVGMNKNEHVCQPQKL